MENFINEKMINDVLKITNDCPKERALEILEEAKQLKGISFDEIAVLLNEERPEVVDKILETANYIKEEIYGKRLVFFAPMYCSNECTNNCKYCAFRMDNKELKRVHLNQDEIEKEAKAIINSGHKRILLVAGEHAKYSNIDYVTETIKKIYSVKTAKGNIRRINVNVAPLSVDEFRKLKNAEIGTYQIFQETYHMDTYNDVHISGKKRDYLWRLYAMDRAMEAGIDDVGIGVLFGLYDYKFETLAMMQHVKHLEDKFNVGPHTISIPRIEPAFNTPYTIEKHKHFLSDEEFKKLVAILRIAVPYTGIILSTRESAELRNELIHYGVSQISAGSKTDPGSYASEDDNSAQQFSLSDERSLDQVIQDISSEDFIPSFCTGCYRNKRTGEDFMEIVKDNHIHTFCQPNAVLTYYEYLLDFNKESETFKKGMKVIESHIEQIDDEDLKRRVKELMKRMEAGERDIYL